MAMFANSTDLDEMPCNNLIQTTFCSLVLLLATKPGTGVPRLRKKESKQFVSSMRRRLTARRPFIRIIM